MNFIQPPQCPPDTAWDPSPSPYNTPKHPLPPPYVPHQQPPYPPLPQSYPLHPSRATLDYPPHPSYGRPGSVPGPPADVQQHPPYYPLAPVDCWPFYEYSGSENWPNGTQPLHVVTGHGMVHGPPPWPPPQYEPPSPKPPAVASGYYFDAYNAGFRRKPVRAAQACDTCRQRKAKCDEGRPECSHCKDNGLKCSYREYPPQRAEKQIILAFTAQLESLSGDLKMLMQNSGTQDEKINLLLRSPRESRANPVESMDAATPDDQKEDSSETRSVPGAENQSASSLKVQNADTKPVELSFANKHIAAAQNLSHWPLIKDLIPKLIPSSYVMDEERERGLLRLYGCGGGGDKGGGDEGAPSPASSNSSDGRRMDEESAQFGFRDKQSTFWKKSYTKATSYARKVVRILLNGTEVLASPDTGSGKDIISENLALEHRIPIQRGKNDKEYFKLGNGTYVRSVGRAYVPMSLLGLEKSQERRCFYVLAKCAVPLILGMELIQKIKLYTKNKHLLVDDPRLFRSMPCLKWIGAPQAQISFTADGNDLVGCADTGSDLNFMSLETAIRNGYKVDRAEDCRSRIMLADRTMVDTIGIVRSRSVQISQFDTFAMDFHILPGLPCEVIFSEEFLDQMDAFNTCSEIMDTEDPYSYGLNTLIYLGPIQAFLTRKWRLKNGDTAQQVHDDTVEAERYRRNQAKKAISTMVDEEEKTRAGEEELARSRAFDRRHERCRYCTGRGP